MLVLCAHFVEQVLLPTLTAPWGRTAPKQNSTASGEAQTFFMKDLPAFLIRFCSNRGNHGILSRCIT